MDNGIHGDLASQGYPALDSPSGARLSSADAYMSLPSRIPSSPRGSSLESLIAATAATYARMEAEQNAFLAAAAGRGSPLACPSGCGSCCEPFVPDVLPTEAAYIAAWLLENEPALAERAAAWAGAGPPSVPPCPFLRRSGREARCAIYPARPLVCRLFGAAAVRDREGRASFRPCARMPLPGRPPLGRERRPMSGADLVREFGAAPPVMADYAAELASLRPAEAAERALLVEALPSALRRVGLSLSLAEDARDRTYSTRHAREKEAVSALPDGAGRR